MKKLTCTLIIILILSSCYNQPADFQTAEDSTFTEHSETVAEEVQEAQETQETQTTQPETIIPLIIQPDYTPSTAKIAIIEDSYNPTPNWTTEIIKRYGDENVKIYTRQLGNDNSITYIANDIAKHPNIEVLVVGLGVSWTEGVADLLKELRDDILIAYIDPRTTNENMDLVLNVDINGMVMNYPAKAKEIGADTVIYFYNRINAAYEEKHWHDILSEKSEEVGITFVAVNVNEAIQCGSGYAYYMGEAIPPLLEEYGTNTVLVGLDNERLFWSYKYYGYIYLPIYSPHYEPAPVNVASNLSLINFNERDSYDIPYLIEVIRKDLAEKDYLGRIASFPMSPKVLFPLAAIEYGFLWSSGDISKENIDYALLEQIMKELLIEYTGLSFNVGLTPLVEDDITYQNHIFVLPDYLIY
ncbi:MAG: DUF3798 domain-containing protein [Oscillospiraceae bacterium]|nr:DUF3798 domain-containing protein [Oscillospiraceae bacterium]